MNAWLDKDILKIEFKNILLLTFIIKYHNNRGIVKGEYLVIILG